MPPVTRAGSTAEALVARGGRPLLAGRSAGGSRRLRPTSAARLETAVADVARPESVRALVEPGDVIVATVGPFTRHGDPAVEAAIAAGALYIDSTGEPAFIRRVFERYGADAARAGASLVTAFGYDWVPGNLAGALALRDAGDEATRVDVGYFTTDGGLGGMSGGTRASAAGAMLEPAYVWRERDPDRTRGGADAQLRGRRQVAPGDLGRLLRALRPARSLSRPAGGQRLPRLVRLQLAGDAGHGGRQRRARADPGPEVRVRPPHRPVRPHLDRRPDAAARERTGSAIAAIAYGPGDRELARVEVRGVNGYTFTAEVLAWGAASALEQGMEGVGALGPASAFGLDRLEAGCAEAGISRVA